MLQAGCGRIPPVKPSSSRACLGCARHDHQQGLGFGPEAVMLAAQAIRDGDAEVVIAGGQENMSLSPTWCPTRAMVNAWATGPWSTP